MSDSFMRGMTFASFTAGGGGGGCDCDECGIGGSVVPGPIRRAMREHKRQKLETGPLKRTQERSLVCRQDGVAVWKWTMPLDAEPLIEYGSTHRVVWVQKLPGKLSSIGTGIIGSSDEENTRRDLEWEEDGLYLVPSNGGKAVGYIHSAETKADTEEKTEIGSVEQKEQTEATSQVRGHAILRTVKIPVDAISEANPVTQQGWVFILLQICKSVLEKNTDGDKKFYAFPEDCLAIVRRAIVEAEEKAGGRAQTNATQHKLPIPEPIVFNPLLDGNANESESASKNESTGAADA